MLLGLENETMLGVVLLICPQKPEGHKQLQADSLLTTPPLYTIFNLKQEI